MIRGLLVLTLILPVTALAEEPIQHVLSEAEVKKAIIAESINAYPGNCPCPYNSAPMVVLVVGGAHGVGGGDTRRFTTRTK